MTGISVTASMIAIAIVIGPVSSFAQTAGGSAGGASSGASEGSGSAAGSPSAGSAGAGTAGVSGVPSGPDIGEACLRGCPNLVASGRGELSEILRQASKTRPRFCNAIAPKES